MYTDQTRSECRRMDLEHSTVQCRAYHFHRKLRGRLNGIWRYRRSIARKIEEFRHLVSDVIAMDILSGHLKGLPVCGGGHWDAWRGIHVCRRLRTVLGIHVILYARNERQKL